MEEPMEKDPRYREVDPRQARPGEAPEPERPTPAEERRRQATPADKPSQAEGER
jgi:hypothetical protein